jgi:predicted porin
MKKALFGTTALVAVGALAAPALAADPIEIGVSGRWYGYAGFALNGQNGGAGEPGENRRNHGLWHESEIRFTGETTLDNGMTVGVNIQLEGETVGEKEEKVGDQVDENYMYVEGNFGRLELGEIDGASYSTNVFLPSAYFYQGPNYASVVWGGFGSSYTAQLNTVPWTYPGADAGDSTRVSYFTPRLNGFQLGVSYAPEKCAQDVGYTGACGRFNDLFSTDNDVVRDDDGNIVGGVHSEIWDIGANYNTDLGGMSLALSAGYQDRSVEAPVAGFEDRREWAVHAKLGSGPFTVGAGYREDNKGTAAANSDLTAWAISGNYKMDSWTFGAGYVAQTVGASPGDGEDEVTGFAVGIDYAFGPGIILMGGIDRWNYEDNASNPADENSFTTLTAGSIIYF